MTLVVADTNIVISGLLWHGNPRRVFDAARDGIVELYTSEVLLKELEEVLGRDKFALRLEAAGVAVKDVVSGYAALANLVKPALIEPVVLRDPDDDAVLACAIAADCDVIVSGDDDLIELKEYLGIRIVTAAVLLAELAL